MMQPKMVNQTNVNIDKWNRINLNLNTFRNSPKNRYSYDAFGNALGNSIVRAGQPSVAEKAAEAANIIGKAIEGAYSQAAINNSNAFGDALGKGLGELTDQGIDYVGNLNFTSPEEYSFANSVAGENLANNYVNDAKFYSNYATYSAQYEQGLRSLSQSDRAVQNAVRNHRFDVGNSQAAADFNAIGVSGFNVDLNDDATRAFFAAGQAAKTNAELQTTALAIIGGAVSIPLMAADAVALGGFALRGGIGLGNSIGATVTELGQSFSAYGVRGTLLRASPSVGWTEVQLANQAAINGLRNGATFVAKNPLATLETGFNALGRGINTTLRNENVQAGLINGFVNTSFDVVVNGNRDFGDLAKTFAATTVGGFVGSRSANINAFTGLSTLQRESLAGFIGNASSELFSQFGDYASSDNEVSFSAGKVLASGLLGASIGGGLVNLGLAKPPVLVFGEALRDPLYRGTIGSYGVSYSFSQIYGQNSPWSF